MSLFKRERKQLDLAVSYKNTFGTEDGKKVLADLIKINRVLSSTFSEDSRIHALNEGKREAILRILTFMQVDFDAAEKRLQEAQDRDNQYE